MWPALRTANWSQTTTATFSLVEAPFGERPGDTGVITRILSALDRPPLNCCSQGRLLEIMPATGITHLIVNSPYDEPKHHWHYLRETQKFSLDRKSTRLNFSH